MQEVFHGAVQQRKSTYHSSNPSSIPERRVTSTSVDPTMFFHYKKPHGAERPVPRLGFGKADPHVHAPGTIGGGRVASLSAPAPFLEGSFDS